LRRGADAGCHPGVCESGGGRGSCISGLSSHVWGCSSVIGQLTAAFLGTVAFGYLFGIPGKHYGFCGLCGSVAWGVYVLPVWGSDVIASFAATVIVAFLSRLFAVRRRCPVTVFLIAGLIPLVPGIGL